MEARFAHFARYVNVKHKSFRCKFQIHLFINLQHFKALMVSCLFSPSKLEC